MWKNRKLQGFFLRFLPMHKAFRVFRDSKGQVYDNLPENHLMNIASPKLKKRYRARTASS